MKDRINQFLKQENISASRFADEIGVQRSAVSHILSGRNNPGFEFIQKILTHYPKIDALWLMLGKGEMYTTLTNTEKKQSQSSLKDIFSAEVRDEDPPTYSEITNVNISVSDDINQKIISTVDKQTYSDLTIDRIVIFYSNNTFKEYIQSK